MLHVTHYCVLYTIQLGKGLPCQILLLQERQIDIST